MWLRAAGPGATDVFPRDLRDATGLREAIHRAGSAVAAGRHPGAEDVRTLNAAAAAGHATAVLAHGLAGRRLTGTSSPVTDAPGVLATDAVQVLGGPHRHRVKTCEGPGRAGLFPDTSRGADRRWCSMNTCGNKAEESRLGGSGAIVPRGAG